MIAVAIAASILIMLGIGVAVSYFGERDVIQQDREDSTDRQNDRVKESIEISLNGGLLEIENLGGTGGMMVGVVLECNDGSMHHDSMNVQVSAASGLGIAGACHVNGHMLELIAGLCNEANAAYNESCCSMPLINRLRTVAAGCP